MRKSVLIIIMIFLVFMIGFDLSHRTWKSMSKINGNFQCFPDTRIYLAALSVGGTSILDSTLAGPTGNFEFNIRNLKKDIFFLQVSRNNFIPVILKPGDYLSVSSKELSLRKDYKLSGSDESEEIRNFEQMLRRSEIEIDSTNDLVFRESDPEAINASYNNGLYFLNQKKNSIREWVRTYCSDHPNSLVSLYMMARSFNGSPLFTVNDDLDFINGLLDSSSLYYPSSSFLANLEGLVRNYSANKVITSDNENRLRAGQLFPEIILPDLYGIQHKLQASSGLTLVFFWRSDCIHCRNEIESLKKLHDKYSDAGFMVYSISLDEDRQKVTDYLAENPLPWIVVSDLKGWKSPLVRDFNIVGTPSKFLLDQDKRIIDKQFTTMDLETLLNRSL